MTLNFYFLILLTLISVFLLVKNVFTLIFSLENYSVHRKRLNQLEFDKSKEKEESNIIDIITKPIIKYIYSRFKPKNLEEISKDLKFAGWDNYLNSMQYMALNLFLKVLGVVLALLFWNSSKLFALIWGGLAFLLLGVLLKNSVNTRKEKLLKDFPDFIQITGGYLSANYTLPNAVTQCIKYMGEEWQVLLKDFVVNCKVHSMENALNQLKDDANIFEIKEFIGLVKLHIQQGGDVKSSFEAQADKARNIHKTALALKIGRREILATLIQAPLLLCNIFVIGLPTIYAMLNLSTM